MVWALPRLPQRSQGPRPVCGTFSSALAQDSEQGRFQCRGLGPTAKDLAGLSPCLSFPRRGQKLAVGKRPGPLQPPGHGKLCKFLSLGLSAALRAPS